MPIVSAVAVGFSASMAPGLQQRLEEACTDAVKKCQAAGITDPDKIRDAVLLARDLVLVSE
jgi:hypothetical protein